VKWSEHWQLKPGVYGRSDLLHAHSNYLLCLRSCVGLSIMT